MIFLLSNQNSDNAIEINKTAKSWAKKTTGFSFAQLKELIISVHIYEKDVNESIERLRELCETDEEEGDDE